MKALKVSFVPVDPHIKVLSQYKHICSLINPMLSKPIVLSCTLQKMMFQMIMLLDPNSLLTFLFSLSYSRSLSLSLYKTWRVSLSTRYLPADLALLLSHLWPPNTTCSYFNNSCYSSNNKHRSLLHRWDCLYPFLALGGATALVSQSSALQTEYTYSSYFRAKFPA